MRFLFGRGRIALMFCFFCVVFGTGQFHRISMGIITPELAQEFATTASALGFISGVYFLFAAAVQIPTGLCFDRFGVRVTIPFILLVACVGTIVFGSSNNVLGLVVGRALMGMGFASVLMGAYVVFARWVAIERFSTVAAVMIAIGSIGGMVGTSPLAFALQSFGWRSTILGVGFFTIVLAMLAYAIVRDAPSGYVDEGQAPRDIWENLSGLLEVWKRRDMQLILAMGVVTYGPGMAMLGLWSASYLADVHGFNTLESGEILFLMALASPIGLLTIGPLDRKFRSRKRVVLVFAASKALAFFWLFAFANSPIWLVMPGLIWIMFSQAYYVALQAHCRSVFPAMMVGRAVTSLNLVSVGGVALVQIFTGLLIEFFPSEVGVSSLDGYRWVFASLGVFILIALLAYSRVHEENIFGNKS